MNSLGRRSLRVDPIRVNPRRVTTSSIWFILGLAGSGKTRFSRYVARRKPWIHLEIDRFPEDGVDHYEFRSQWDRFLNAIDSEPLVDVLGNCCQTVGKRGVVLSFPSNLILPISHIRAVEGKVEVVYLYGPPELCLQAFLRRERETGRNLGATYWHANNDRLCQAQASPALSPYLLPVFSGAGERRSEDCLLEEITVRIAERASRRAPPST